MTGPEQVTVNELARRVSEALEEVQSLRNEVRPAVAFYARMVEAGDDLRGFAHVVGKFIKYGTAVGASVVTILGGLRILGVL